MICSQRGIAAIIFILIALAAIVSGYFAWQYWAPKEAAKSDVSIVYTSENYAWGEQIKRIEVSKDGKISYSSKIGGKKEESSRLLTEEELKGLSDFIISQKFFDLPDDLTNPSCADAPTEYLEITINQKTHRSGGGCVMNEEFRLIVLIVEKLERTKETIIELVNSAKTARAKARDLSRQADIRQIVIAMEFIYYDFGGYLQSKITPDSIGNYLTPVLKDYDRDGDGERDSYFWLDNTVSATTGCGSQRFCVWAELESGNYFVGSEKGSKEIIKKPSQCPCM